MLVISTLPHKLVLVALILVWRFFLSPPRCAYHRIAVVCACSHQTCLQILRELHKSCQKRDGSDDMTKGSQLLEIYALEIQLHSEKKDNAKLKARLTPSTPRTPSMAMAANVLCKARLSVLGS